MAVTNRSVAAVEHPGTSSASILVVDDDPGILGFLELALLDEGYTVRAAPNGKDALERIAESAPDLILLDMNMPVMDGWEFCARLRDRGQPFTKIPVVVMTAARDASTRSREVGAQGFLGKPFDLDHLFQTIHALLNTP